MRAIATAARAGLAIALAAVLAAAAPAAAQLSGAANEANRRGAQLGQRGDLDGALREFSRVIELAPESPIGWYNRGLVRRDQGDCRSAAGDFSRVLERDARHSGALYHRGNCMQALGDSGAAAADYTRVIELPGRVDGRFLAHRARGDVLRRSGALEQALADYTRVAELRADTTALRSRAWVQLYLGRWKEAHDDAARFLREGQGKEAASPYVALVGHIALRRLGQRAVADAFLDEWAKRFNAEAWPAPVLRHLRGTLGSRELAAAAGTPGETTEAQVYIGVGLLLANERAQGVKVLKGVLERGEPQYWEYDLAFYELRRLGEVSGAIRRPAR